MSRFFPRRRRSTGFHSWITCNRKERIVLMQTRDGQTVNVPPNRIFKFVKPVLGFEGSRHFALYAAPGAEPFHWLQSIEDRSLSFPVIPAVALDVAYNVDAEAMHCLEAKSPGELQYWIIMALPADGSAPRANLRAPVVIHQSRQVAAQIIMREEYSVRAQSARHARELVHAH